MSLPKEETVCFNIKFAWHAINRMYNSLGQDHDVSTSVGFVLLNIDADNGTPATKIGPQIGMEARSLTRMLKTLEEKGLIYRQSDQVDKRLVRIYLTEEGKTKRNLSREAVIRFNEMLRECVDMEKLEVFFDVIRDLQKLADKKYVLGFTPADIPHQSISPDKS